MNEPLTTRTQTRGVLPKKVSDLPNDIGYVTREELDSFTEITGYTGKSTVGADVSVDNTNKTIEVNPKVDFIFDTLPKDRDGKFIDGDYFLCTTVIDGVPNLYWLTLSLPVKGPYYYGQVKVNSLDEITPNLIKNLSQDGFEKSDKEYIFISNKQRQVMAYPAEFGELSSIVHKETGIDIIKAFEKLSLIIDGVRYYVYVTYNPSTGAYTYLYNY